jgi:hypothetical protein
MKKSNKVTNWKSSGRMPLVDELQTTKKTGNYASFFIMIQLDPGFRSYGWLDE